MEIMYDHPIQYPKFTTTEYGHYKRGVMTGDSHFKSPFEEYYYTYSKIRKCSKCHEEKRLTEYNTNCSGSHGFDKDKIRLRRPECRDCTKQAGQGKKEAVKLAKSLGISHKAPEGIKCELCNKTKNIVFDHDHEKNVFRGWLCDPCNRSMGVLGDNAKSLLKTVAYLSKGNNEVQEIINKLNEML